MSRLALTLQILLLSTLVGCSSTSQQVTQPQGDILPAGLHYNRDSLFGTWIDEDHDCQNTRAEILIARSSRPVTFTSSSGCTVDSGQWLDPYTGAIFYKASQLQIDHVVPLHKAWELGAWAWTKERRVEFANDTANLLAVSISANASKGDRGPDEWLPSNQDFAQNYKSKYSDIVSEYFAQSH